MPGHFAPLNPSHFKPSEIRTVPDDPIGVSIRIINFLLKIINRSHRHIIPQITILEKEVNKMKYICKLCGYIYDEEKEDKKFADLPDEWVCPLCGAEKSDFEEV